MLRPVLDQPRTRLRPVVRPPLLLSRAGQVEGLHDIKRAQIGPLLYLRARARSPCSQSWKLCL